MKKRLLLIIGLLLVLLPLSQSFAQVITVERISGQTRYDTSIKVSQAGFSQSYYAIIASGENYPDAMAGGQLAGYLKAPLLITPSTGISAALQSELGRLGVQHVYLLGGTTALPEAIATTLRQNYQVTRLSGNTRLETSQAIVNEVLRLVGPRANTYYTVSDNFPDALAAAPFVVSNRGIMYLNSKSNPIYSGIAIGGPLAVPGTPSARIAGNNRYETAVAMAQANPRQAKSILLVSGLNYPDALSAAGYGTLHSQSVLLTDPYQLSPATANYIKAQAIDRVTIVGGPTAISETVANQVRALYQPVIGYDPRNPRDGLVVSPYPGYDIKGNISSSGEKIYHVPGQRDYAKTIIDESRGERWFKTEQDAKNAGWRKALR